MTRIPFTFPLANGLHARPASLLQELCLRFDAVVVFRNSRRGRRADTGSVLELVSSGTMAGDPCLLEVSGPQEKEAARALRAFLLRDLLQAEDNLPPLAAPGAGEGGWLPPFLRGGALRLHQGRAVSPGIGRAIAVRRQGRVPMPRRFASGRKGPARESRLFQEAMERTMAELRDQAEASGDPVAAGILKAHQAILSDRRFSGKIASRIAAGRMAAGAAIGKTAAEFAAAMRRSPSVYLRERAADIDDIAARLGERLYGKRRSAVPALPPGGCIVVAGALSPSELLSLDRRPLRGLVLGEMGPTSHTAILARTLGIPAVALAGPALAQIAQGQELVVDGRRGLVLEKAGPALRRYYRLEQEHLRRLERRRARLAAQPARTRDNARLEVAANIGSVAELDPAWRSGAEGVGLFRSETLFLERDDPPGEDEQYEAYARAARTAAGRPVIIRTLDVGGDKRLPYLRLRREENPFLGCRAVRFYAEQGELIRCQLRAILRAARHGRLKVMVPMVTRAEEVRLVRRLLAEAAAELSARGVPHADAVELGVMVETPAAALSLDLLRDEADFFSVGSNDLLQYTMAADRGDSRLAGLHDPLHPAFLRLLQQAAAQARKAGRWLGLCGEMAGSSELLPLLVGIGFNEVSMAPGRIPGAKERLAELESGECRALLRRVLAAADAAMAAGLLGEFNARGGAGEAISAELVRLDSSCRTPGEAIKELCCLLELSGRVENSAALEDAVWKREEAYATDLGFGFALPHGKAAAVKSASIAFLRPARAIHWSGRGGSPVRGVLLIAVPEKARGEEHLKLIARLSRRLMHEEFRKALLSARSGASVLAALRSCLAAG